MRTMGIKGIIEIMVRKQQILEGLDDLLPFAFETLRNDDMTLGNFRFFSFMFVFSQYLFLGF
jgi:hypothetical protein